VDADERTALAIERLYRERAAAFTRMAAAIAGPGACADAVQEGFARAYARRATYRGDGSLAGWVWRIVLRAALDARGAPATAELEDVLALPFPERDPELATALRALAPRRRTVVFLRYFADLSLTEIAQILGIAEGTVSATLAQARAELHAALADDAEVSA
jgi:RNA polymerase sigma-70 factor (ECF subfamily)